MNFEDLIGIIIFISIVLISSIFRAIKEAREAKEKKEISPKYPTSTSSKPSFPETKETLSPKRKIIIKTEGVEISIPPSPVEEEIRKETLEPELPKVQTYLETQVEEVSSRSLEQDYPEEGLPSEKRKIAPENVLKENLKKIKEKEKGTLPTLVKPLYKKEITFTAPMERATSAPFASPSLGRNMVLGTVGGIPQLHWAIIMMELLSPPKSLRDDF